MRTLLVTPGFHGYWRSIARALEAQGDECLVHVYDDRAGLSAKLWAKVAEDLPRRLGRDPGARSRARVTHAAVAAIGVAAPDRVLIIKGDTLEEDFWGALEARRLPRVVWLYDEVRRTEYDPDRLARLAPVASYSRLDTVMLTRAGVVAAHVPLAFDEHLRGTAHSAAVHETVFVGARYPRREETLLALQRRGVAVRAFGADWSHHPIDRLRTWDLRRPALPAGRDLSRVAAYRVMAQASSTLNIHGDQDGFTMRTFEASGAGAVQLIDRPDVAELYEPGREVLPYAGIDELVDLCERARRDRPWAERLRAAARRRTLAEHTFGRRLRLLEPLWG